MDYNVASVLSVQLVVVGSIAAALLMYLMRFRRSRLDVGHKAVLVTGCDGGLGLACAQRLHSLGLRVFAGCVNPDGGGAKHLRALDSPRMHVVALDGRSEEKVQAALQYVEQNLPLADEAGLWAIVHASGSSVCGFFEWQTWQHCEMQVANNLVAALRIAKTFIHLVRMRHGRFVNVSMLSSQASHPGFSIHAATKAAVDTFAASLQAELGPTGFRSVTVSPAEDLTDLAATMTSSEQVSFMWQTMHLECKRAYKKLMLQLSSQLGVSAINPAATEDDDIGAILDDLELAVLSKYPRSQYTSASLKTKLRLKAMTLQQDKWNHKKLARVYQTSFLNEQIV